MCAGSEDETRPRQMRWRRPSSGRKLRLTSSFDDGCNERERIIVNARQSTSSIDGDVTSQTADTGRNQRPKNQTSEIKVLSCKSKGHDQDRSLTKTRVSRTPSLRNQLQKRPVGSPSLERKDVHNSAGCLTPPNNDGAKSRQIQAGTKTTAERSMSANIAAKKLPPSGVKSQDTIITSSRRAVVPVRRKSLDIESRCLGNKLTATAGKSSGRQQRYTKGDVPPTGSMSANSSPRVTRSHLGNCTAT